MQTDFTPYEASSNLNLNLKLRLFAGFSVGSREWGGEGLRGLDCAAKLPGRFIFLSAIVLLSM